MSVNIESLKREMVEYLDGSEFAVFRGQPGTIEASPVIRWDVAQYPDYHLYLDTARKAGVSLVIFVAEEFESAELEDALEQLDDIDSTREERREFERKLREFRVREGFTCSLQLAFEHHSHLFVYEVQPDWYEEFLELCDEVTARLPVAGEGGSPSLGGFYSNN